MMNHIINDIAKNAADVCAGAEMYTGEDGLLYCSKCNTARQCVVPGFGLMPQKIQFCMCKCMVEEEETKQLQLKTEMTNLEIANARQLSSDDPAFKTHTFANDNGQHPELMKKARKYADDFQKHLKNGSGLLLCGNKGTGKTYAAEAIANRVIDQNYLAIFTTFGKIAEKALEVGYEGRREFFESLMNCPLLIIDDVGTERETDYMMETIQRVIDDRDRSFKPLIVTTNFTADEINHPSSGVWQRVWSRIMRTCYPIKCDGNDMRAEAGKARNKAMKKYFEDLN